LHNGGLRNFNVRSRVARSIVARVEMMTAAIFANSPAEGLPGFAGAVFVVPGREANDRPCR